MYGIKQNESIIFSYLKIQKEILFSIFFVIVLMGGVTLLSFINAKKSVASADNISRLRVVSHTMREIDDKDAAWESIAHKYVATGDKKYYDSCLSIPVSILSGIDNLEIFGAKDSGIEKSTANFRKEILHQQKIIHTVLFLVKDSNKLAQQVLNADSTLQSFYTFKNEINQARENESFLFATQITVNQESARTNLHFIFIRSAIILLFLLLGLFMINQDIQKRIKAERAAQEGEQKYAALIEGAGDLVCTFNHRGTLTFTSSRIASLTGYTKQEMVNKHYSSIIAPEWREKIQQTFKEQLKNKKRESLLELQLITKQGEKRWVEVKAVLISGSENFGGLLCICRDINVRKTNELERVKASRNQEIFLANMSHEIRTPMNGIIGLAHLLTQTGLNTEQNEYLKGIRDSARKLLTIINDILDISKINAGKIVLEEEPFSISELIDNALLTLGRKAKKKNINIHTYLDPDIPKLVLGDHVRLSQIIWNVAGNAVKYTRREGEVTISVIKQVEDQNHVQIGFIIKDNGIGIETSLIPSIFEPFIQANPAESRKYGTGLGLSITKKLIEMQGGVIGVQSKVGEGSQFTFRLNFKKYAYDKPKLESLSKDYSGDYKNLIGLSVLLVEDNIINQKVGVKILEKKGLHVDVAENGKKATEMVLKKQYNLILMDLQMPEMNGFEATRAIRTKMGPELAKTPIIAITAAALQGEYEQCMAAGMNDYILKPFEPKDLFDKMEYLVNLTPIHVTT